MTPSIVSREFHTKFFPRLLWSRLRPEKTGSTGTTFSSNTEKTVVVFACLILAAIGLPTAISRSSVIGWTLVVLGIGGILFLVISSILSERGTRPTYDNFLTGIFFFFIFLGFTAGLLIGSLNHFSTGAAIGIGITGIVAGYIAGIFGGLWAQYLGWISGLLNGLAGLAIFGMVVVDLLLLFG